MSSVLKFVKSNQKHIAQLQQSNAELSDIVGKQSQQLKNADEKYEQLERQYETLSCNCKISFDSIKNLLEQGEANKEYDAKVKILQDCEEISETISSMVTKESLRERFMEYDAISQNTLAQAIQEIDGKLHLIGGEVEKIKDSTNQNKKYIDKMQIVMEERLETVLMNHEFTASRFVEENGNMLKHDDTKIHEFDENIKTIPYPSNRKEDDSKLFVRTEELLPQTGQLTKEHMNRKVPVYSNKECANIIDNFGWSLEQCTQELEKSWKTLRILGAHVTQLEQQNSENISRILDSIRENTQSIDEQTDNFNTVKRDIALLKKQCVIVIDDEMSADLSS
ncbi:hypothetical protein BDK51DRAFT_28513 [Blyttiomyces helicus]|uniref:Uncharacterized protein n=1 Tax=Blyttiomyces helicus TaxID=388810 RepID=A0A4P9VZM0_9FUNG|nr:hypothetical protein BDK51DRAFT_28513 [Blyttiomyces helicus]|eukprot:RKO83276.1 hypothetical protein BDK51DRAFT_28513 [Blyttiomyces helicus]